MNKKGQSSSKKKNDVFRRQLKFQSEKFNFQHQAVAFLTKNVESSTKKVDFLPKKEIFQHNTYIFERVFTRYKAYRVIRITPHYAFQALSRIVTRNNCIVTSLLRKYYDAIADYRSNRI